MPWHIQHRKDSLEVVERHPTPERAIERACELLDLGHDVFGIGTGDLADSIGGEEIARIYRLWVKARVLFK